MDIRPEPGWKGLAQKLKGRTAVFIGTTDAGKTTLIRCLLEKFLSQGEAVSLVDSDIGQSSLGLPGTVSMRTFRRLEDLRPFRPERMLFVGTTNPTRRMRRVVEAARSMVEAARGSGAGTILVDTTGLVLGWPGRALKLAKIRAIEPDVVVALERTGELEHIVSELGGVRAYRLRASRFARRKTPAQRIGYRRERLREYFKGSETTAIRVSGIEVLSDGEPVDPASIEPGTVVSLNMGESTLGLGVFEGVSSGALLVRTPLARRREIDRILVGEMNFKLA